MEEITVTPKLSIEQMKEKLSAAKIKDGEILSIEYCPAKEKREFLTAAFRGYDEFLSVHLLLHPTPHSSIGVTVGLPIHTWNGKFLGLGNGGAAGSTGTADLNRGIALGFATAHTDLGTNRDRVSLTGNPEIIKDFGYRATHLMTETAKSIIAYFYGDSAISSAVPPAASKRCRKHSASRMITMVFCAFVRLMTASRCTRNLYGI